MKKRAVRLLSLCVWLASIILWGLWALFKNVRMRVRNPGKWDGEIKTLHLLILLECARQQAQYQAQHFCEAIGA